MTCIDDFERILGFICQRNKTRVIGSSNSKLYVEKQSERKIKTFKTNRGGIEDGMWWILKEKLV